MRLTKHGHACVRLERAGTVLVIDPGGFTEAEAVTGADAILVTHEHVDHLDVEKLTAALAARPGLTIHTHPDVAAQLSGLGAAVHPVVAGEFFTAAGFRIRAIGGRHAVGVPGVEPVANLGFLVEETVYHPGDALDLPTGARVETLLVPVMGPWQKLPETLEFLWAVAPRQAYAIHDHLLAPDGVRVYDGALERFARCDYTHLPSGSTVDLAG